MRVKRIKIGISEAGTIFGEAAAALDRLETGRKAQRQTGWIYFSDVREVGKVLTPKRLEILKAIRDHHPDSVRALAQLTGRNVKNVADDLQLLASLGFVDLGRRARPGGKRPPRVPYDTLTLEVHL